ncbi:hypothetical protein NDU88_002971 [Pleurodeles waltl]|uniref:Uncharacterized protein n=1 Tax=Pleurodeles waltl TaxID=8319 RepID=A0AAV7LFK7_PLEWA|nr:hypothetical protein NDU88_002971 [Pleurodeles waltl]
MDTCSLKRLRVFVLTRSGNAMRARWSNRVLTCGWDDVQTGKRYAKRGRILFMLHWRICVATAKRAGQVARDRHFSNHLKILGSRDF